MAAVVPCAYIRATESWVPRHRSEPVCTPSFRLALDEDKRFDLALRRCNYTLRPLP